MSNYLILPDIHLKHEKAQKIIDAERADFVICLGDFFDDFGDTPEQNIETAKWLKKQLKKDNFIALYGNHDIGYQYPENQFALCSGWTKNKSDAINSILSKKDWNKTKWFYNLDNKWLLTHAGLTKYFLPINTELTIEWICDWLENQSKIANIKLESGDSHWFYRAGQDRGGLLPYGGIIWSDCRNFQGIDGINQIFGHTPRQFLNESGVWLDINGKISDNACIDSWLNWYVVYDGKNINIKSYKNL